MIPVLPMADEPVLSQFGRWYQLNRISTVQDRMAALQAASTERVGPRTAIPTVALAAHMSEMDMLTYVRMHTMLPFMAFRTDRHALDNPGWSAGTISTRGHLTPRSGVWLCPSCVKEDQAFWGFSFWRRAHQLPGVFWCEKHSGESLRRVADKEPFLVSPWKCLVEGKTSAHTLPESVRDNASVVMFNSACQTMLDQGRIEGDSSAQKNLRARAISLGLHVRASANSYLLSDLVVRNFPREFLVQIMPALASKSAGKYFAAIDDALWDQFIGGHALGNAFAFATLYPSIDQALSELSLNGKSAKGRSPNSAAVRSAESIRLA